LAQGGGVLYFLGFREHAEERLRFFYLVEFRRRRKAFERRCEHGVRVSGTPGRSVKLR
jgi:hypothetical protein